MYLIQAVVYEKDSEGDYDLEERVVEQEVVVFCTHQDEVEKAKVAAEAEIKGVEADEINVYNMADHESRESVYGVISEMKAFVSEVD